MNRREILRYTAYFTGAALSAPVASALLVGCKRDEAVAAGEATYQPGFFDADEYEYITKFADTLLPRTDTPSASDVGVPEIIDKIVGEVYSEEDRNKFRDGLTALRQKMDADNAGGFSKMDEDKMLVYLQDQDVHYKNPDTEWDKMSDPDQTARGAYFDLKSQVVGTYCNTEEVATTMLAYLSVPGEYIPCGDLQELTGGRAWAI